MDKNMYRFVLRILKNIKNTVVQARYSAYDFYDFIRHSSSLWGFQHQEHLRGYLTAMTHNIEKGLSLPNPRLGYGKIHIQQLIERSSDYISRYGADDVTARAQAVLRAYVAFNETGGMYDYPLKDDIQKIMAVSVGSEAEGGVKSLHRSEVKSAVSGVGIDFFNTRSSVRIFTADPIDLEDIKFAVEAARKAPSVCNRQSGFVHILTAPEQIQAALQIQGGARGFGEHIPLLLVLTTRTANFWGTERNQRWVDGGLFSMSVILALHSRGLSSCCLNWSKSPKADLKFKAELNIPVNESIILLLAVGFAPDQCRVAISAKRPLDEMFRIH
jgi:nitroreductase